MHQFLHLILLLAWFSCISSGLIDPEMIKLNQQVGKMLDINEKYKGLNRKQLSYISFTTPPIPMSPEELHRQTRCSFLGAHCPTEAVEHGLVDKYLLPADSVLELGGRFGTTSCHITSKQKNSGKLVTVEPDSSVWNLLAQNRIAHSCNFWIYHGVISNESVIVEQSSYATRAVASPTTRKGKGKVPTGYMEFDEIQKATGVQFNALLIDCEGCLEGMFRNKAGNDTMEQLASYLQQVEVIIIEADMPVGAPDCMDNCVDYKAWLQRFESIGFTKVHEKKDTVYSFIYHYVLERVDIRKEKRVALKVSSE
jgi:hypothetical protein